jgi:hypothetical protein
MYKLKPFEGVGGVFNFLKYKSLTNIELKLSIEENKYSIKMSAQQFDIFINPIPSSNYHIIPHSN